MALLLEHPQRWRNYGNPAPISSDQTHEETCQALEVDRWLPSR